LIYALPRDYIINFSLRKLSIKQAGARNWLLTMTDVSLFKAEYEASLVATQFFTQIISSP
jgi:hypothetical protein